MSWTRQVRALPLLSLVLSAFLFSSIKAHAEAALLLEEPYGFFGVVTPGGHSAIYLDRVCAETPLKLRRCNPGELGSVLTRDPDVGGYDWIAIPLLPYLYSVENASEVPRRVNKNLVWRLRLHYHESHLYHLGRKITEANFFKGGWDLLIGQAYDRRMFAFRFETSEAQDDALITRLNAQKNRAHFHYLFNNCSDFTRKILNAYFPGTFKRSAFPDFGLTTPRQVSAKLVRFAGKHPEMHLAVFEISQIPGYRRPSGTNRTIIGSITTRGIPAPVALLNPYVAGGMVLDFVLEDHNQLVPKDAQVLGPDNLLVLRIPERPAFKLERSKLEPFTGTSSMPASDVENSAVNLSLGPSSGQKQ